MTKEEVATALVARIAETRSEKAIVSATVKVDIRQLPHGEGLALPAYQSAHAAGLDLLAAVPDDAPLVLAPGQHALVPTGLTIALPPGYEAQVRPRSGLAAKHGVTVLNAPGTVDADYRGEIGVLLINHGDAPFAIRRGERIAQMVIAPVVRAELVPAVDRCPRPIAAAAASVRPAANSIKARFSFRKIAPIKFNTAFFRGAILRSRSGLLPADSRWGYCHSIRERRGDAPGVKSCGLGQTMSGVIVCDASDLAVVHITGTQRPDRTWRRAFGVGRAGPCRRSAAAGMRSRPCSISTARKSRC